MKQVDIDRVYTILKKEVAHYDVPIVDLIQIQTNDPYKVLVTTILSARTKDATTAAAAQRLFAKAETIDALSRMSEAQIAKLIHPVGFTPTKARHLKQLKIALDDLHGGDIPHTVEELVKLPGVGRKTANLVVAIAFDRDAICVDTHVHRIMNILGYVRTRTPHETEMRLRSKLPRAYWKTINSMLVAFGQHLCTPVSPWCSKCPIRSECNRIGVGRSR
ncbi:MAG: endonuclease III [Nanoarchaeota archaeon]